MTRLHRSVVAFEADGYVAVLKCGHRRGPSTRGRSPWTGRVLFCRPCSEGPRVLRRTPCGTKQGYCKQGCRCRPCTDAYARWARERRRAKRAAREAAA